eukprot:scaffold82836_cov15-Tisochrysis_lutea.AAC.1
MLSLFDLPSSANACSQIDLTDDYVMAAVFGDGSWEANVQRVQAKDDASGEPVDLQMPMDAFRDLISLMS